MFMDTHIKKACHFNKIERNYVAWYALPIRQDTSIPGSFH